MSYILFSLVIQRIINFFLFCFLCQRLSLIVFVSFLFDVFVYMSNDSFCSFNVMHHQSIFIVIHSFTFYLGYLFKINRNVSFLHFRFVQSKASSLGVN